MVAAPARFPRRRLLATLGLRSGRPLPEAHGAAGGGMWRGAGSATTSLTRDGAPACNGSAPLRAGLLDPRVARGRFVLRYLGGGGLPDPLRTRCPGPLVEDVAATGALARGSIALSALRRRSVTVPVDQGRPFSRRGWQGATRASLTVRLRRRRVDEDVYTELVPRGEHSRRAGPPRVRPLPLRLHLRGQP